MKQKFNITGMTCSACSAHVEKAVSKMEGVRSAAVSLMTNSMVAEYDEGVVTAQDIIQAVTASGYGASLPQEKGKAAAPQKDDTMERELASMKHRLIWSFVFLIPLFYISMGHMMGAPLPAFLLRHENAVAFGLTQLLLTLPIMYLNDKYYKVGFKTLWHRAPNMDSLIAVGSIAAVIYGVFAIYQMGYGLGHGDMERVARYHMDLYFESAGMILTLITLGKFLETRSKGKTSQAITRLMDLAPKTASVLRGGVEVEIPGCPLRYRSFSRSRSMTSRTCACVSNISSRALTEPGMVRSRRSICSGPAKESREQPSSGERSLVLKGLSPGIISR